MDKVNRNLLDYVKVYDDFLDPKLCNDTINSLKDAEFIEHTFYHHALKQRYKTEKELAVSHVQNDYSKLIDDKIYEAIVKYIQDFDYSWFEGFDGFTKVRFNKYDINTQMHLHADRVQEMFDGNIKGIPTLSVVGLLNNNFEGGDFFMFDNKVKLEQGSIMLFPSTFMYPHYVTEVTSGTRYSFVSWVW